MKHLRSLLIKFVLVLAVLSIVLGFLYGVSFGDILTISLLLTMGAYLLGDMFILPAYGNTMATIADFGLAYFGTWLIGAMIIEQPIRIGVASFLSAILIAVGEVFFHRYLVRNVLTETEQTQNRVTTYQTTPSYQTEMGEENYFSLAKNRQQTSDTEFVEEILPESTNTSGETNESNQGYNQSTDKGSEDLATKNLQSVTLSSEPAPNQAVFSQETNTESTYSNQANYKENNETSTARIRSNTAGYDTEFGDEIFPEPGEQNNQSNEHNVDNNALNNNTTWGTYLDGYGHFPVYGQVELNQDEDKKENKKTK
ncbi:YndM family protein [Bacillus andreraoultii]|uniref:YndM family protein n=1 Tax=Bacillus andreraoultii TaxID=1499685 RepID=UPI00067E6DFC|nr:YndM family protein [Bacillus andreraoultii]